MPPARHGTARDSMAWCMLRCRVAAVRVLCACTPHLYKPLYPDNDYETCSLDHLLCLSKYRETLQSYATQEAAGAGEQESEVGLRCPHCRRDCARLQYSVRSAHSQYHHLPKLFKNILSRDISFVNTSVIRVYFARSHQDLLVAETNLRWFQIFSMQSSQWVCVTGVTAVSVLQLLYHAGPRLRHHWSRRMRLVARRARRWSLLGAQPRSTLTSHRLLKFDISMDH
ncbi:PREDICTED: uncharacterized protein LOC106120036 [Papilio xuthus]|uniref:Uncharacterized protein LOC106120036 n=1 Tax=Papilio xuthus TaxID=66420 RepID=A0AAJ6ZE50_PAPXU|nr:PREDICTED: uncharacterized protein LOC106120036 [Papilio xuthus]